MHQNEVEQGKVVQFKELEKYLYVDISAHVLASRGVDGWDKLDDQASSVAMDELREAVEEKRELLEELRELEPLAALEECRAAIPFAEQITEGTEAQAQFEITLRHVRIENVKPEYAQEAEELAAQCKPFLQRIDTQLEELAGRIEVAKSKAQDDPGKLEKIEELKQWREVAIVEGRDTAGIDKQIVDLQEEIEANKKAAALAAEEAEILTRHAEQVAARRDAVAAIVAHIEGVACAFKSFLVAAQCNKLALELAERAAELGALKKQGAQAPGFLRFPDAIKYRYRVDIPRLEGNTSHIDEWGKYNTDYWYTGNDGIFIARIDAF